ncbi:hypothetical protein E2C01_096246 [Portunus trituberculatus]|uniref:Uncharacterized protein n=1 Tax=Portunus trituberculatus TaxID=210409 RepID=A0A5B7JV46_PORTR|nr:hypothetical protein [Portunus trituberculatus]
MTSNKSGEDARRQSDEAQPLEEPRRKREAEK